MQTAGLNIVYHQTSFKVQFPLPLLVTMVRVWTQRRAIYNLTAANFICLSKSIKVNIGRKEISGSICVGEERFLA